MSLTTADLLRFHEFATACLANGEVESIEDLAAPWYLESQRRCRQQSPSSSQDCWESRRSGDTTSPIKLG